jgi:hypothetical protein
MIKDYPRLVALISSGVLAVFSVVPALNMQAGNALTLMMALVVFGTLLAREPIARRLALFVGLWAVIQAAFLMALARPIVWDWRVADAGAAVGLTIAGVFLWRRGAAA